MPDIEMIPTPAGCTDIIYSPDEQGWYGQNGDAVTRLYATKGELVRALQEDRADWNE